jgi:hypothetical protein
MADLVNEFSWSKSRDETFRRCPRQYYFQYYGSWGGWDAAAAEERTRTIYVLKQLQTRQMWAGSKVHDCIKKSLQNLLHCIDPMPEKDAVETTLALMRKDFSNSRRGDYWRNPKTCGFFEHEYSLDIADRAWKETADHVVSCLRTFYRSDVFGMIRTLPPEQWLDMEKFSSFQLDVDGVPGGVKVHVVLDFSFRDDSGGVTIYDWKTGRSESERNEIQLACYTFYATKEWDIPADRVQTIEFNLASGRKSPYLLKGVGLDSIGRYIAGSIRDMRILLADAATNQAVEDRFTFTRRESTCTYCNFRKVCPRWEQA